MPPKPKKQAAATNDNRELLTQLLAIPALPAMEEFKNKKGKTVMVNKNWTETEALLNELEIPSAGQAQLVKFLSNCITELPNNKTALTRSKTLLRETLDLVGEVLDHHILNDSSYKAEKTKLRKVLRDHFMSDQFTEEKETVADRLRQKNIKPFLLSLGVTKFDNAVRITKLNDEAKIKRDQRHNVQLDISQHQIDQMCQKMISDIESGDPKYKTAILLLTEVCLGARFGECVMAATFTHEEDRANSRKKTVKTNRTAPKIMQMVRQTGLLKKPPVASSIPEEKRDWTSDEFKEKLDLLNRQVLKPCLPYVEASWLIEKLTEWRRSRGITDALEGTYNLKIVGRDRNAANKLLQTRYMDPRYNEQIRLKTHLLRAIYAVSAFDLFREQGQSENKFIHDYLGHDAMEVSLSYNFVNMVPDNEITNLDANDADEMPDINLADDANDADDANEFYVAPVPARRPPLPQRQDNLASSDDDRPITRKEFNQLLKQNEQILKLLTVLIEKK